MLGLDGWPQVLTEGWTDESGETGSLYSVQRRKEGKACQGKPGSSRPDEGDSSVTDRELH